MAAPQLRLDVSLNLTGFRSEIQKLTNIAQGEFAPKINVKFNRQTLDTELNNLQAAIKRRAYRVEIGGNIDSLPDKIKALKEQLSSLESFRIDLGVGAIKSLSQKDASKIKSDLRAAILGEQKKLYIPTSIQPKISRDDVRDFKNAVKSKLTGLSVDVKVNAKGGGFAGSEQGAAGLMQYMRSQGMVGKTASGMEMRLGKGGDDIKQQLSDAVQSAEKIKSVFDGIAKNIATTGKSIANVQGKRLGLGNVPLIAGSVEKKVERSTSSIEGTTSSGELKALYPEINRAITSFVALRGQIQQNTSKLSGFSLIIGLAAFSGIPLAKSIVKLTGSANNFAQLLDNLGLKLEAAVIKAASNILGASSGRLLSGTSLAGLLPSTYRGIGPAASPAGLLPPAYRGIMPARETAGLLGAAPAPAGLLPSVTSRGATGEMMRQLTGGIAPPSSGGGDDAGKLAMSPRNLKERVDAILRDYFKVVEVEIRETFNAPRAIKAQLSQFDALFVQAFDDIQNTIRQVFDTSRKAADKVAKQNQIDVAIQSFVAALEAIVRNAERNAFAQSRIAANKSYVQKANVREVGQPLLGEGRIPRMLPPSTGFYRGPYSEESPGETQSQLFARREREARMRSAQRSLRISSELPPTPRLPGTVFSGDDFTAGGGLDRVTGTGQPPQRGGAIVRHPGGPQLGAATRLPSDYFERGSTTDKYRDGLKLAAAATESFRAGQIPFISGLKSIAGEFGEATKQVLLYGTAYKGLAFITSLPGQILNAAKSQQQFNNGLQTATQSTGTFAKELLYVDNVQRAFGLNLQTTRTGFTRLFASMAPTGFDSGSIEKLFTGISAATASLQLTPDKAERVIYAFGQMASKGQIMSEELKGQLGDVLPGALSLFADAAGMSVKQFSEAMERGEFVGSRFREVFAKVSDELMNRFGTGAQAAARSLQGLINVVGGDFQRTLESFAPLANAAAESILKPLGGAFRQLSVAARLATGEKGRLGGQVTKQEQLVQDLGAEASLGGPNAEKAKEQYEGAKLSLEALKVQLENFNELAKDPAVIRQAENIKAFTDEIGKAASFVQNFVSSIGSALSPVLTLLGTNLTSVIGTVISLTLAFQGARLGLLAFVGVMTVIKGAVATVGLLNLVQQVGSFSAALAVNGTLGKTVASMFTALGVSAKFAGGKIVFASGATMSFGFAVKALLATTGLGLLILVIGSVGAAFAAMGEDAKRAAEDAKQAAKDMAEAARTGNVPQVEAGIRQAQADVPLIKEAQAIVNKRAGQGDKLGRGILDAATLSDEEQNILNALGLSLPDGIGYKKDLLKQLNDLLAIRNSVLSKGKAQLALAEKQRKRTGQAIPDLGLKGTEPPEEDKEAAKRGASLLNAIEQREEAIADARKQREESIASIRKNAAEEFTRMEQALADRRLNIEREIIAVKQKSADTLEDIQRQIRIARGEDSDIVGDEQKIADIYREERDANLEITQRIADEEKEQARNIAAFQKKVAQEIQGANEAHTKRMGEIQRGYAKQVAKIIEDGTGKAAKRMAYAGELAAKYIERASLLQARASVVIPDGSSLPIIPRPVASGSELAYPNLTPDEVPDQFKRIDRRVIELERNLQSSRRTPDIGEQLAGMLSAEGGFEDIAGLEPLPIQKMYQQVGRPFTQLYKQIQRDITGLYAMSRREAEKVLKPDPKRTQAVLKRAERVETVRQTWNPLEAQSKELLNRTNPAPRSKPSTMSLPAFDDMLKGMLKKLLNTTLSGMSWSGGVIKGDLSSYLTEGQLKVIRDGSFELVKKYGLGYVEGLAQGAFKGAIREGAELNKIPVKPRTGATLRGPAQPDPLKPNLNDILNDDDTWLQRYFEQTEPPRLNHGFSGMEGASLPSAGFDITKVATDFGTIAAASILRGVLDVSRVPDASRSAQIAQAHNVNVGDRVGYYQPQSQQTSPAGAPYDMPAGSPEAIRTTESRGRLQSTVQNTAAGLTAASLELVFAQITEDSAKASAEMTKQIDLIKEQAALIRNGINSELAAELVQLEATYIEQVERIKARKLEAAAEQLLIKEAEKLRDTLIAQTKERILQSKILDGEKAIENLKEEIKLLLIINDEERKLAELREQYGDAKAQEVFNLAKIKENIEATRALVDGFVSGVSSDYKGFLKAVISGEDAVDALKQFQAGLTDKVLTIFLDFTMAPVEKFFKESLLGFLNPKVDPKLLEQEKSVNALTANTTELKNLTTAIKGMGAGTNATSSIQDPTAGNAFSDGSALPPIAPGFDAASVFGNPEALTGAFGGVQASISESMNGIVSSFENGASSLGNALPAWDTALSTNIPDALKTATNDTNKATPTFQESLGKVTAGIGIAAGAIMGIAAGISQIKEGGTSNVLGGIGSVLMSLGGAVGGFAGFLKGANGGVASGGWKPFPVTAFANGGMVNGPTLGLVGEGKYNEAIVPLPDGKSIPVQMRGGGGGGGLREAMSGSNGRSGGSPILNMSFQSTNINGVEYVSRDQLEQAMAATRRQAVSDGAKRGMSMTLDKLQQSPSTRSRLGMGGR